MDLQTISSLLRFLGKLSGMAGLAGLVLAIVLSLRWRFMERPLGGLPQVYHLHHIVGTLSFVMILLHPLFLSYAIFLFSPEKAFSYFFDPHDPLLVTGHAGILTLFLFMTTTFFLRPRYHIWKWVHMCSGVSLVFASWHIWLARGSGGTGTLLLFIFSILGIALYLHKEIWFRFFLDRPTYRVTQIRPLDARTSVVKLRPQGEPLKFRPGQFAYVSFFTVDPGLRKGKSRNVISHEAHPFTISSPPQEDEMEFLIRALGDHTTQIQSMPPGGFARIEGPYGEFLKDFDPNSRDLQIWVAGGIGMAPFLSYARACKGKTLNVEFHYALKSCREDHFHEELQELANVTSGLKIYPHYDDQDGIFHAGQLLGIPRQRQLGHDTKVFICGPPAMQLKLKQGLLDNGVNRKQMRMEDFSFLPEQTHKLQRRSFMKDMITISMSLYILSAGLFYLQGPWAGEQGLKEKGASPKKEDSRGGTSDQVKVAKTYTLQEVKKHDKISDCWMVIRQQVYDVTPYISLHPTKPEVLTRHCGQESTQAYENKGKAKRPHSPLADQMLEKYRIGNLEK